MGKMKKKLVKEAPIDLEPGSLPINPNLKQSIERDETPFSKSEFIKKSGEGEKKFLETASEKRIKELSDKIRHYMGGDMPNPQQITQLMMSLFMDIKNFEDSGNNKEILEKMAVKLVEDEVIADKFKDYLDLQPELVGMGGVSAENMQKKAKKDDKKEEPKFPKFDLETGDEIETPEDEDFDFQVAKRRFINALVQGVSKKGHYMFEFMRQRLERMQPGITNKYGAVMAINDYFYWTLPPQIAQQMASQGMNMGGSVEWEMEENEEDDENGEMEQNPKLVIKAKGIMFPIVVHELIKGYYGMLQSYHLPEDPEQSEKIKSATDVLENEMWDIIVGSLLWERMLSAYPMSAFEDNAKEIQSELFVEYTKLIKPEFEKLNKLLNSYNESDRAKAQQIMERIANDIFRKLQQSSLSDTEEGDDDLDDIDLSSLGF
jgi:hypothetical protein